MSLQDKVRIQAIISWKKLRLHLGLLTKEPYKNFFPREIVEMLEWWKKQWEKRDEEVMKWCKGVLSAGKRQ